jgi:phenylalanyl-tRNA synthetase beta chain
MNPRLFNDLALPPDDFRRNAVKLQNPLSEEQGVLRTTLIPNILQVMHYNFNRQVNTQLLFEIGKIFIPAEKDNALPQEKVIIALALSGQMPQNDWQNQPKPLDYFYLKGIVEALLESLGIKNRSWREARLSFLHPTRGATLVVDEREAGFLGALHPAVQEQFEFKQEVYLAELSAEALMNQAALTPSFKPLPRYPAVFRDVAFTVSEKVSAGDILQGIKECGGELLEDIRLFDVYQGSQIPQGYLSLAFALTFRHSERTLKDEEIDAIQENMEKALQEKYGAYLRKF